MDHQAAVPKEFGKNSGISGHLKSKSPSLTLQQATSSQESHPLATLITEVHDHNDVVGNASISFNKEFADVSYNADLVESELPSQMDSVALQEVSNNESGEEYCSSDSEGWGDDDVYEGKAKVSSDDVYDGDTNVGSNDVGDKTQEAEEENQESDSQENEDDYELGDDYAEGTWNSDDEWLL